MGVFRFKRFEVVNERSAMKVNTDGVLLGASMTVKQTDRRLLDIGTGTGTIALMAAQRLTDVKGRSIEEADPFAETHGNASPDRPSYESAVIHAIDIDQVSVEEARLNFEKSSWGSIMHAFHSSLDEFSADLPDDCRYDLIFSNPPYFEDSLLAPLQRRSNARHTSTGLSYRELLDFASSRLSQQGRISIVLPAEQEHALCRHARMNNLHLFRILRIRTVERKEPCRIVAEFSRNRCDAPQEELLTIQSEGKYTQEYLSLTHEFYLFA